MEKIKAVIIEEHNEAFLVWDYAIRNKWIPNKGNFLLHVDEHADMGTPCMNISIHEAFRELQTVNKLVYEEFNIATFIVPSIYLDIINKVFWVKHNKSGGNIKVKKRFVYSYKNEGKLLVSGDASSFGNNIQKPRSYHEYDYYWGNIDDILPNKNVILDIDMDYFSCGGEPRNFGPLYLEITRQEYDRFTNNRYHPINYINIPRIECRDMNGKYYYVINNFEVDIPNYLKVGNKDILKRIDKLVKTLYSKKINPEIISICRSAHSKFTPSDQVNFIQENLLKALMEIYSLEIIHINQIATYYRGKK
ncbi:peptide arginase, FlmR/OhkR family [Paramaledivibacter caminithermalis]|jgi:hypothetical protein|uniref:UPF0489 domain-containing protein n=1 Tax=Paramaledivibacter caminithermalis (strain DSM 15212 / CIP 107654 / DViRD3) TaxID=1121301 RepID=A0A1M6SAY3_PARC5|nr:UPF0489 family protein [Paramaledivibacter caminithermalis]SHK41875.1 UPF0489 domain-containing protein [Paramaledivibacter caminithermalis DSM 15212]